MINFIKMQALGNDFIIIKKSDAPFLTPRHITFLANRKLGIGADQVIIYQQIASNQLELEIYNANGSTAEACGNAFRCLAQFYFNTNNSSSQSPFAALNLITAKKTYTAYKKNNEVSINMGLFNYACQEQIKEIDFSTLLPQLALLKNYAKYIYVNVGNPHIVLLNDTNNDIAEDINVIGPFLEQHAIFPNGVNVEIITINNVNSIGMHVWERGVGKTLACGTGACAAFLAANYLNLVNYNSTVIMPGGELKITLKDGYVYMQGEANLVFTGQINIVKE